MLVSRSGEGSPGTWPYLLLRNETEFSAWEFGEGWRVKKPVAESQFNETEGLRYGAVDRFIQGFILITRQ